MILLNGKLKDFTTTTAPTQIKLGVRIMCAVFLSVIFSIPHSSGCHAATRNMTTCSQSAFIAAYDSALPGDTIAFPSGDCSILWNGAVLLNKANLTIKGAGIGKTIIDTNGGVLKTIGEAANGLRITDLELRNCQNCLYMDGDSVGQASKNIRIDNCRFSNAYYGIHTEGFGTGVADHNIFDATYAAVIYGAAADRMENSTYPVMLGTDQAWYFEDNLISNTCNAPYGGHFIASNTGSRYVLRYNTFSSPQNGCRNSVWDPVDVHGYGYRQTRGSYTWEIYENNFDIYETSARLVDIRGGQGVIFNNRFRGSSGYEIVFRDDQKCDLNPSCVYPCKDQINNTYAWGNKYKCGDNVNTGCSIGSNLLPVNNCNAADGGSLQLDRDYHNTRMPEYVPFAYPHPLTTKVLDAPQNLTISPPLVDNGAN